ncbi:MAG: hypothetical protein WCI39_10595 [Gallionellaceae bacterium]
MKKEDFYIGLEFYTAYYDKENKDFKPIKWRCSDVGTRVIVAIKLDQPDSSWYNGPPYAVSEMVFDEDDVEGCALSFERL